MACDSLPVAQQAYFVGGGAQRNNVLSSRYEGAAAETGGGGVPEGIFSGGAGEMVYFLLVSLSPLPAS